MLIHLKYRGVFVYKLHAGCVIRLKLSLIVSETRYISLIKVSKQKFHVTKRCVQVWNEPRTESLLVLFTKVLGMTINIKAAKLQTVFLIPYSTGTPWTFERQQWNSGRERREEVQ